LSYSKNLEDISRGWKAGNPRPEPKTKGAQTEGHFVYRNMGDGLLSMI